MTGGVPRLSLRARSPDPGFPEGAAVKGSGASVMVTNRNRKTGVFGAKSLAAARRRIAPIFSKLTRPDRASSALRETPARSRRTSLAPEDFPVPSLVLLALHKACGLPADGPFEKTAWVVFGEYDGWQFSVAHQKFGLRLYVEGGAPPELEREIARRIRAAVTVCERYLEPIAQAQAANGNITIDNHFHRFDGAYHFFRDSALKAYTRAPQDPVVHRRDEHGRPTCTSWSPWEGQQEGGYLAAAMLDAYFSRLEHILILLLPFAEFDVGRDSVVEFACSNWARKFKRIFDVSQQPEAKKHFAVLKTLKEQIRNRLSHGGMEKRGDSFYFHLDGIGAIPAKMTRRKVRFEDRISHIPHDVYLRVCAALDDVERFLESSALKLPMLYVKSGLPVACDEASREEYRAASVSEDAFKAFVEGRGRWLDRLDNMDF